MNNDIEINDKDFFEYIDEIKKGDFVYLDPPYFHTLKKEISKYNGEKFLESDLNRLKLFIEILTKKKVYVMFSNSNFEYVRNLFKDYRCIEIEIYNNLTLKGGVRVELLFTNYNERGEFL